MIKTCGNTKVFEAISLILFHSKLYPVGVKFTHGSYRWPEQQSFYTEVSKLSLAFLKCGYWALFVGSLSLCLVVIVFIYNHLLIINMKRNCNFQNFENFIKSCKRTSLLACWLYQSVRKIHESKWINFKDLHCTFVELRHPIFKSTAELVHWKLWKYWLHKLVKPKTKEAK